MGENMKNSKVILSIILALLCLIVSQVVSQLLGSGLYLIKVPQAVCNIIAGVLYVILTYILIRILINRYLHGKPEDYNIPRFKIDLKWLLVAMILPIVISMMYIYLPGEFKSSHMSLQDIMSTVTGGIFYTGLGVGLVEEIVFRGLILNVLNLKYGKRIAVLLPSVLFGILHIIGMDFSLLSIILVVLAGTTVGIMFSLISLEKHSIWNSGIVHAIWNIIIIGGFLSIGDRVDQYGVYSYVLNTKQFAITGGEFGIEASIIAVMGYIIVSYMAYLGLRKKVKQEFNET